MSDSYRASTEAILSNYLAPAYAQEAAAQLDAVVQARLASMLGSTFGAPAIAPAPSVAPAAPRRGRKPGVATKAAPAPKATKTSKATKASKAGLTADAHEVMRFKKKLYWAQKREAEGKAALPGDAEVIAANKAGKVINIDKWAKAGASGAKTKATKAPKAAKSADGSTATKSRPRKTKARSAKSEGHVSGPEIVVPRAIRANGAHRSAATAPAILSADAPL